MYNDTYFLTESPVVNKLKSTMTLYHASLYPEDTLIPRFVSIGNKLEKQQGKAIFFFSKKKYAMNYAVGSASYEVLFREYINEHVMKKIVPTLNEEQKDYFYSYVDHLRENVLGEYFPPVYNTLSYDARLIGIDDRGYSKYPLCTEYFKYLHYSKMKVYVHECEVETSKIKHGHSKDFQEFTVFEPVPVKKSHVFYIKDLISTLPIRLISHGQIINYRDFILNGRKDIVRSVLQVDNWSEKLYVAKKDAGLI